MCLLIFVIPATSYQDTCILTEQDKYGLSAPSFVSTKKPKRSKKRLHLVEKVLRILRYQSSFAQRLKESTTTKEA